MKKNPNENCLEGMQCPKCRSYAPFMIAVEAWAEVHDNGIEETTDHEWTDKSTCGCTACGYTGTVGGFRK